MVLSARNQGNRQLASAIVLDFPLFYSLGNETLDFFIL